MSRLLREDTAYSSGFSESAFRSVSIGQSAADVRRRLGTPHEEGWFYFDGKAMDTAASEELHGCRVLNFAGGALVTAREDDACKARGVGPGLSLDAAISRMVGAPPEACWDYSWSPSHGHHRQRTICVEGEGGDRRRTLAVDSVRNDAIYGWRRLESSASCSVPMIRKQGATYSHSCPSPTTAATQANMPAAR